MSEAVRETLMEARTRIEAQLSDEQLEKFHERRWMRRGHARRGCGGGGDGDRSDERL